MTTDLLRLDGIGARLGGREIVRDVTFSIRPGEFTGLIGPNGAGKTTLLRAILGLQPVTTGSVLIDGAPRAPRDASIGYVPQKLVIEPDMPLRVRDVVSLGVDGHKFGIRLPSRARRELVSDMLTAVGAQRYANARVGELSGGEQQRVMIAHALISRPRLLLLDEPLANLDISSEQGHRLGARPAHPGRPDRRAAVGARHEPADAGDGPDRLRGRGPGGGWQHG
jgi:zinc/manganese transport system ATP-binding protein